MTIPADQIVSVLPGVIGTGGNPLALNAVMLTHSLLPPINAVLPFPSADAVSAFFGPLSAEAALARVYFLGFDNSTQKPGLLYFAQYPSAPVAAYLRGGSLAGMTLTQLQALSGSLTVVVDGAPVIAASIDLSAATSFSDAASIIATALTIPVAYSSQLSAFTLSSTTTGASSTIAFATGTLAAGLKLTSATGAVLSQGSIAGVPSPAMDQVKRVTQNWALFMTVFEPLIAAKEAFGVWTNGENNRYAYIAWDTDINATEANNTVNFGYIAGLAGYNAVCPIYGPADKAAFICGAAGSIDFNANQGRITFAFKSQSGLGFDVTDETIAQNLIQNKYNFYGSYATANEQFNFFYPGQISGEFKWLDSYVNQIYLNAQFQLAFMTLLTLVHSVPYNPYGYGLITQTAQDPINAGVNFGSIQPNVPLSAQQAAVVNIEAGLRIDNFLSTRGWYFQIIPASAQTRGNRESPGMNFWYTDGQSVQKINMASIDVL